jgi:hypothetical protein
MPWHFCQEFCPANVPIDIILANTAPTQPGVELGAYNNPFLFTPQSHASIPATLRVDTLRLGDPNCP